MICLVRVFCGINHSLVIYAKLNFKSFINALGQLIPRLPPRHEVISKDIEMYSTKNKGKRVVAKKFIGVLKTISS